jgi:hypothetical protein
VNQQEIRVKVTRSNLENRKKLEVPRIMAANETFNPYHVPPHPTNNLFENRLASFVFRMGRKHPVVDPILVSEMFDFFENEFLPYHFPDAKSIRLSVDLWLDSKNYPESRKNELRKLFDKVFRRHKHANVKSFIKDEFYDEYKPPRGIHSRTDMFKLLYGPLVSGVEEIVFKHPSFVKKIPHRERPDYITNRTSIPGAKHAETDFSAWESSMTPLLRRGILTRLYDHFYSHDPASLSVASKCIDIVAGTNQCHYNDGTTFYVQGRMMSGEMDTSLFNGITNFLIFTFLFKKNGGDWKNLVSHYEGDDGLNTSVEWNLFPTESQFNDLGLTIKMRVEDHLYQVSFCGLIFDPVERALIYNFPKVVGTLGWCSSKYIRSKRSKLYGLLKMKCLSYQHTSDRVPIASYLVKKCYDLVSTYRMPMKFLNTLGIYDRDKILAALAFYRDHEFEVGHIGPNTRHIFAERFKVPVEMQLRFEELINSCESFDELNALPWSLVLPSLWNENYCLFVDDSCVDAEMYGDQFTYFPDWSAKTLRINTAGGSYCIPMR